MIPRHDGFESRYRWLVTATDSEGLLAAHGFITNIHSEFRNYEAAKAYVVTDRPVYRPGQDVKFSAWVRQARYDLEDISRYAARDFMVRLTGPRGKTLFDREVTTGTYGEFHDSWALPEDARLGKYQLRVWARNFTHPIWGTKREEFQLGSLDFWVEEYKKPEYEVTVDAPTEPVVLGDAIEAAIAATTTLVARHGRKGDFQGEETKTSSQLVTTVPGTGCMARDTGGSPRTTTGTRVGKNGGALRQADPNQAPKRSCRSRPSPSAPMEK